MTSHALGWWGVAVLWLLLAVGVTNWVYDQLFVPWRLRRFKRRLLEDIRARDAKLRNQTARIH